MLAMGCSSPCGFVRYFRSVTGVSLLQSRDHCVWRSPVVKSLSDAHGAETASRASQRSIYAGSRRSRSGENTMTFTIDLTPDLELRLRKAAAAEGTDPSEYARR